MSGIAFLLTLICVVCYVFQGFFNKLFTRNYHGQDKDTTPVFVIIYSVITALAAFMYNGFAFHPSLITLLFGVGNGIILFLFNLSQIGAAKSGPFSFQNLMLVAGNIVIPLLFATMFWGDRMNLTQWIGIAVMAVAIIIFNCQGLTLEGHKKGYFGWVLLLFASNGIYGIILDSQQRVMAGTERNEMIIISFTFAALISLVYLLICDGKKTGSAFKMNGKAWICVLLASVGSAVAINLLLIVLNMAPVSIVYVIVNGALFVVQAILGLIVFKEKLTWNIVVGAIAAIVSMVLLNI